MIGSYKIKVSERKNKKLNSLKNSLAFKYTLKKPMVSSRMLNC